MFDNVVDADILPGIKSDHSPITLHLAAIKNTKRGKGIWKLNNSFLNEEDYVRGITTGVREWSEGTNNMNHRERWEYLKYKIRNFSIIYGKRRAKERVKTEQELEIKLKLLEEFLDRNTQEKECEETNREINEIKSKLEELDNYRTDGLIMRSRCQWYE